MEKKLNVIQQLQQTPKWKEFEEWYKKQDYYEPPLYDIPPRYEFDDHFISGFESFDFEFQKGVFEKFIENQHFVIEQWMKEPVMQASLFERKPGTKWLFTGSFEELLIWYFNN